MEYVTSLIDLVGNTPLVQLDPGHRGRQAAGAGQGGVPEPRWLGEGPDRGQDDRGGRAGGTAEARRHHRRADQRQHRGGTGHRRAGPRLPLRLRLPRQGQRGQAERAGRVRGEGGGLPDRGRARPPRLLLLGLRPAGPRDRRGVEAGPVLEPEQPGQPLRVDRAGDLAPDRGPDHPLRGGDRHRRHHQRHRSLPEGRVRGPGPGDRRRSLGLGLLRRQRPAVPGRGRRRGLLAGQLRPRGLRSRSSRSPTPTPSP